MDYAREELLRQRQALAALLMGGGAPERQEVQVERDRAETWTEAGAEDAAFPVEWAGRGSPVPGTDLRTAREPVSEAELRITRQLALEAALRTAREPASEAELRITRQRASEEALRTVREPASEAELRMARQAAGAAERPPETEEEVSETVWGQSRAAAVAARSGGRRNGSSAAAAAVQYGSAAGGMRLTVPGGLERGTAGGNGTAGVLWTVGRTVPVEGGVDLRAVSRAVERDARRYDGGFTIY